MAKSNSKSLPELIQKEVAPIKEQMETLKADKDRLLKENASLRENVSAALSETESLRKEKIEALSRLRSTLLEREIGKKKIKAVVKEAQSVSAKAKSSVDSARRESEKKKRLFVETATAKLEKHVNNVVFSAYTAAVRSFEKDFSVLEENALHDMGRILSPYLSNKNTSSKIQKLQESLVQTKEEMDFAKKQFESQIGRLKKKLNETLAEASKTKTALYKEQVCKSLPNSIRSKAMKEMDKAETISDVKRIYMSALRESARLKVSDTVSNPVEDTTRKGRPEVSRKPLNEAKTTSQSDTLSGMPDINDPDMLKLAGVED